MKIFVDKGLLEDALNAIRKVTSFIADESLDRAEGILKDVLHVKNRVQNVLIVNPDTKPEKASEIIDQMLKLEVNIFGEEWQLNNEKSAELRVESDRLKNQLLSLISE